jgi:hypothetical protein
MNRLEQISAISMLLLASIVVFGTSELTAWEDSAPGPRFMPLAVAGASALLASLLLLEVRSKNSLTPADWPDRAGAFRVILTTLAIWGFLLVAPWLGFVLGSAALVLFLLIVVTRCRLGPSLIVTVITAALIQGVFVSWLSVALPKGILGI